MHKPILLVILFFLFSIVACGQGELSRTKAKSLLEEKYNVELITSIPIGNVESYRYRFSSKYDLMLVLVKKGYITYERIGYEEYKVTLQPSISPYVIKKEQDRATLNLGKKSIKEITGINKSENKMIPCDAIAEFTYEFNLTQLGKEIPENILAACLEMRPQGEGCFAKYDDGWRLKKL